MPLREDLASREHERIEALLDLARPRFVGCDLRVDDGGHEGALVVRRTLRRVGEPGVYVQVEPRLDHVALIT